MWKTRLVIGAIVFSGLMVTTTVEAADYTWTDGNAAWATAGNWSPAGGPPGAADTATFTGAVGRIITLAANAAATVTITNSGNWTWTAAANSLTVGAGGFNYGSSGASTFSAILAGTGPLRISQGGTLTLDNSLNTFSGGIEINAGRLIIPYVNAATYSARLGSTNRIYVGASTAGTNDAMFSLAMLFNATSYVTNPITIRSGNSGKAALEITVDARGAPPLMVGACHTRKRPHAPDQRIRDRLGCDWWGRLDNLWADRRFRHIDQGGLWSCLLVWE
jgi:autotransporter-associated beta strand protein